MIIAENETPQPAAFISAKCKQVDRPPMPKEQIRQLTTGVDYVVAIVDDFVLKRHRYHSSSKSTVPNTHGIYLFLGGKKCIKLLVRNCGSDINAN